MFSGTYKRYALAVMTAVLTLNYVDRVLMQLLLQPIKEDLDLSDTQLGLVTGIAFGLFYAVLGLPIARWADRGNRVTITSLAIGMWGLTVMGSVFVSNFSQLVVARVAAAVGEAGCKPPTYTLVGDYFPNPSDRTRAMAIYLTGGPLSGLIGFLVGGWLNELYGWRMTFFLVGIPGLMLAALVRYSIVEPRTQTVKMGEFVPLSSAPSLRTVASLLWHRQALRHLCIALILIFMISQGIGSWFASFMMRSHGMETAELGLGFGLILSGGGVVGTLLGGFVASRWLSKNERAQMRLSAISVAALFPCFVGFLLFPQKHQSLTALVPMLMMLYAYIGPTYSLMQRLVPDDMRATMMAIVMLLANLIGMGIGPLLVGMLSDVLIPILGKESLRYAMLIMSLTSLLAAYHFWRVGRTVEKELMLGEADLLNSGESSRGMQKNGILGTSS